MMTFVDSIVDCFSTPSVSKAKEIPGTSYRSIQCRLLKRTSVVVARYVSGFATRRSMHVLKAAGTRILSGYSIEPITKQLHTVGY